VRYCVEDHQKDHWPHHSQQCPRLRKINALCFKPNVKDSKLKNVTVSHGTGHHAICIGDRSRLIIEDCIFSNHSLGSATCVNIYGAATAPVITRSVIHNSSKHGVFVGENAHATIENVEISNTGNSSVAFLLICLAQSGIHIRSEGVAIIKSCKIHDSMQHGIFINESGRASVENNEIYDIEGQGIMFSEHVLPSTIQNNRVYDCREKDVGGTTSAQDTACDIM
jgi:hypothetical protein